MDKLVIQSYRTVRFFLFLLFFGQGDLCKTHTAQCKCTHPQTAFQADVRWQSQSPVCLFRCEGVLEMRWQLQSHVCLFRREEVLDIYWQFQLSVCLCRCEGVLDCHRHVERGLHNGRAHPEHPPAVRQKRDGADPQDLQPGGQPHGSELA